MCFENDQEPCCRLLRRAPFRANDARRVRFTSNDSEQSRKIDRSVARLGNTRKKVLNRRHLSTSPNDRYRLADHAPRSATIGYYNFGSELAPRACVSTRVAHSPARSLACASLVPYFTLSRRKFLSIGIPGRIIDTQSHLRVLNFHVARHEFFTSVLVIVGEPLTTFYSILCKTRNEFHSPERSPAVEKTYIYT